MTHVDDKVLENKLVQLDKKRKKHIRKLFFNVLFLVFFWVLFTFSVTWVPSEYFVTIGGIALLLIPTFFVILIFRFKQLRTQVRKLFYTEFMPQFLNIKYPELTFDHNQGIDGSILQKANLFVEKFDDYTAHNLFAARYENKNIQFSDVQATYINRNTHENFTETLINGSYIVTETSYDYGTQTLLITDLSEMLLGSFSQSLQKIRVPDGLKLIKLDDQDFEDYFIVYTQGELPVFMNEEMRQFLVELHQQELENVRIAFKNQQVLFAFTYRKIKIPKAQRKGERRQGQAR